MLRLTLLDHSQLEIPREEALELLPYGRVLTNPNLKHPVDGLVLHRGKIVPVLGPLPSPEELSAGVDERPWILLMNSCGQVIRGLPEFREVREVKAPLETAESPEGLLQELDNLLKTA